MAVADASYGTDKQQRRSISGAIYTVGGTITGWLSKAQNHTTLSSSEAEYAALASAGQELIFITNVIEKIELSARPGIIFGDNESALALVKNRWVLARIKHIDIRHHYFFGMVQQYTPLIFIVSYGIPGRLSRYPRVALATHHGTLV